MGTDTICVFPHLLGKGVLYVLWGIKIKDICDSQLQSNKPAPPLHSCDALSSEILYLLHSLSWLGAVTLARLGIALLSLTILFRASIS